MFHRARGGAGPDRESDFLYRCALALAFVGVLLMLSSLFFPIVGDAQSNFATQQYGGGGGPGPDPEPQPSPTPVPVPEPTPTPQPTPVPTATPEPSPTPIPNPVPPVDPQPNPPPAPQPSPTPVPAPDPTPTPQPSPAPAPSVPPPSGPPPSGGTSGPSGPPAPGPATQSAPQPDPDPATQPVPQPDPGPDAQLVPQPDPGPDAQSVPRPDSGSPPGSGEERFARPPVASAPRPLPPIAEELAPPSRAAGEEGPTLSDAAPRPDSDPSGPRTITGPATATPLRAAAALVDRLAGAVSGPVSDLSENMVDESNSIAAMQAAPGVIANADAMQALQDNKRWWLGLGVIAGTFAVAGLILWKLPMKRF